MSGNDYGKFVSNIMHYKFVSRLKDVFFFRETVPYMPFAESAISRE